MISTLVVTSEDRTRHAESTIEGLLRKAFLTRNQPLPWVVHPPDDVRPTTKAAMWRAKRGPDAQRVIDLVRYLAYEIQRGDTVVAFHYDADCAWPSTPAAHADFEVLRNRLAQRLPGDRAHLVERLVPIVARWCVESWTYQHTSEAAAICRGAGDEKSAKHFEALASDRASLDTFRPHHDDRFARVGRDHNHRLATHAQFPAAKALEVGASFAAAVSALSAVLGDPT